MLPERFIGSRDDIAADIARNVETAAREAILARGVFVLGIPGGSVADVCLPLIARLPLEWEHIHIFWVDERAVPIDSNDSNAGQALKLWHDTPLARRAEVHVMNGADENFTATVKDYTEQLQAVAGRAPVLDIILLGVGEDGHVASLFPGHSAVHDTVRVVILEDRSPKPPANRLSLTLPVLTHARTVIIAAFGDGKADAMQQALENEASELPVALVIRKSSNVRVMLDAPAASKLHSSTPTAS